MRWLLYITTPPIIVGVCSLAVMLWQQYEYILVIILVYIYYGNSWSIVIYYN